MKSKLILIGGVSRSGKSTLAQELVEIFPKAVSLDQDDFVLEESQIPKINDRTDWEDPKSIHWDALEDRIQQLTSEYEFVILEGIFAFNSSQINEMAGLCVYLELDKPSYLARRSKETRWGDEPSWYLEHVWHAHDKFANPYKIKLDFKATYSTDLAKQIAQTFD